MPSENTQQWRKQMMRTRKIVLSAVAAILAVSSVAPIVAASPRSGELAMTKECSAYFGHAGEFCTFLTSSIKAIPGGARVYYAEDAGETTLDTDVVIIAGPGNVAAGHCTLDFQALPGRCTFSGGTGRFKHFHATAAVSVDSENVWHWDGTYAFGPHG
jgi:hypothetical protein